MTGELPRRGRDVSRETSRPRWLDAGVTHDRVLAEIIDRARKAGALAHHCRDSRYCDGSGLPDVILAGIGGVAFIEVKTGRAQPRPEQNDWLCMFRASGAWAMVCAPEDLANGNIDALITAVTMWPPADPEPAPARPPTPGSG